MTGLGITGLPLLTSAGICLEILVIDLLLSADNALVIALACRGLPPQDVRRAAIIGTAGAIAMRIALAVVVQRLLGVSLLRLAAGFLLFGIAVRLTRGTTAGTSVAPRQALAGAIVAIIVADAVMSLDNVVAIVSVARGSIVLVGIGLALSVPMLVAGSTLIHRRLTSSRLLVTLGGMFLGWIAGQIAIEDPIVAGWHHAIAAYAVPAVCALLVLIAARLSPRSAPKDGPGTP